MLKYIKQIEPNPEGPWLTLQDNYKRITQDTDAEVRVACTLVNAILTQERQYFALTRDGFRDLMLKDPNIPEEYRKGFSTKHWSRILAILNQKFGLIKFACKSEKKRASGFEVIHPELIEYLKDKINSEKQLQEVLAFCQKKS